jgi:hypothetical protein
MNFHTGCHNNRMGKILRVFAAACLAAAACFGQGTTATLSGTATDTSGAVVAEVTVRTTSLSTNTVREVKTDAAGNYSIPFLESGDYKITATREGFQSQESSKVTLQVGQSARIDFAMQVGSVNETVNVSASSVLLQTENATVGTVIDGSKIVDLPLNGRNFIQLTQLIPGVQAGTPGSITVRRGRGSVGQTDPGAGATSASANGQRDTANRYFLDGVEVMDYDAMTYSFSPSVDSLAEFKVETSSYGAEVGGAPGAQVSIITRGGSNKLKGTLWEFNRNDAFTQTYDAIAGKSVSSPRLNRNQFGANIGGPVILPKLYHGKDKTFFFFNWESGFAAQGAVGQYRTVPTVAQRSGDFRSLTDSKGVPLTLKNPLGANYANNVIPQSLLSPQTQAFLAFEPTPNITPIGTQNYLTTPFSATSYQHNYTTRIDHNFSTRDTISGRYVFNNTYEAGVPVWGHDERNNLGTTQNVALGWIHTFGPSLVNEAHGGWHRFNESEVFGTTNNAAFDVVGKMNLPLVSRLPEEYGPPTINVSGADGGYDLYNLQRQIGPRIRSNGIIPITDTLSWQHGRHFLKMGAEFDRRSVTFGQSRSPRGAFGFDGTYTGAAIADFLLGYVKSASVNPAHTSTDLTNLWQGYFINDDWKVTPRLTLTLGLRYDYFSKYKQKDDKFADIYQNGFVVGNVFTPSTSPYGRGLIQPDYNNFGPRFGFAYRPTFFGESVIRGGYGIYYTPEISNAIFAMAEGAQATAGASVTGNLTGKPNIFFNDPFSSAVTTGALNFAVSNDQNMRDSYIQQWNLNVQHKLPGSIILDVGYVGAKGTRLYVTYGDLNRPLALIDPSIPGQPSVNSRRPNQQFQRAVQSDKSNGNSIYHALQAKAEKRAAHGITFLSAFTYAKSISGPNDIGGQVGGGFYIGSPQDVYNARGDRSTSGFDLKFRYVQTILYDVPFFKNSHGVTKYVLDGWQMSTIMTFQSGFPGPITYGVDTTGTGVGSRPDVVAGQNGNLDSGQRTWAKWFNTAAFAIPPNGRFGTAPRTNAIRLPGTQNVDFSVTKSVKLAEARQLEFRTEFFNLANHYNPDPQTVDLNIRSRTFGSIGAGVQGITTRVIQFGAKLNF